MGGGSWQPTVYSSSCAADKAAGRATFDHSYKIKTGKVAAKASGLLDPKTKAGPASPFAGQVMREVAISDEHPNPTAVAIILDVTGSNITAAHVVHEQLPQLCGTLQRSGGIDDPQILIAAIGDANSDRVPLQVGQFESDNRIDQALRDVYLEGAGGGQTHETYELAALYLARHSHLEPFHKQGRKGYAFFIGDEMPYDKVRRGQVADLIGDTLEADLTTKEVFDELTVQYNVFYLFQEQGSYAHIRDQILAPWKKLLGGEHVLALKDPKEVCVMIAGLLALLEGGVDVDDLADELKEFDPLAVASVSKSLALVGGGGAVAKVEGSLDVDSGGGVDRL